MFLLFVFLDSLPVYSIRIGKSAVLAAIQICLGAGARRTHRARNLKDLVRKDSTTSAAPPCAKIRVTLSNAGSDAYCPAMYGDAITVERTIALTGGYNGYKLLDHKGVEKSRAKKDLDDMLDTLYVGWFDYLFACCSAMAESSLSWKSCFFLKKETHF